ncbi:MAG: uracil-DNA glycosylase [Pontimonas sp.]
MPSSRSHWGDYLVSTIPSPWAGLLGEDTLETIREIGARLEARVGSERIVPSPEHVFRALEVSPSEVRVLLIGQDPYPNPEHAMGWSFSVPRSVSSLPPSARNILTELREDMGIAVPDHFELGHWVKQGVLLLNRHLTTAAGAPGAHHSVGWEALTNRIVEVLVDTNPHFVAIVWGRQAAQLIPRLGDAPRIESAHPSPLSAHRGFFGSRPFSSTNALLEKLGREPIDWSLES